MIQTSVRVLKIAGAHVPHAAAVAILLVMLLTPAGISKTRPAEAATQSISVREFSFTPNAFSVAANDPVTVTITNTGATAHTFTIAGVADTGAIAPGTTKTVQFTRSQAGTLVFYCTIHGQAVMSGQLTVTAAAPAPAPAPPAPAVVPPPAPAPAPAVVPAAPRPAQPPVVMRPPSAGDGGLLHR